jgi:BirA family biotin operon repressor/biotin-[acetyl-CoA-carboxylase] ligase
MSRFGRIERVGVTGSTNDDMARILGEERARGLTLVADYQQRGAGRKGRAWIAPAGSALLCTIALPDPISARDLWAVPFWTALVLAGALDALGVAVMLQWPNDVLLGARKLAGILCVSRVTGDSAWAACGIGVNVRRPADPREIDGITPAPAYVSDAQPSVDRDALLHELLACADARYDRLADTGAIVRDWERAANLPGKRYSILTDGEQTPYDATALRLLTGGALLVEVDGAQREVTLADARVMRA